VTCAGLAGLAVTSSASAAGGGRVALRWSVPEGCPDASRVTGEVDRLLGDQSPRPTLPLEVAVTVTSDVPGEFKVHLETQGEGGPRVREIKGASCTAVADVTALLIALILDPAAVARAAPAPSPSPTVAPAPAPPAPPPPAPVVSEPAVPRPVPTAPPVPEAEPARAVRPSFRLQAWTLADAGSLPGISVAFGGKAALVIEAFRFELGAGAWLDRSATLAERPSVGGDVGLVAGSAGACWSFLRRGPFELGPCLAFELGRLHADGFGATSQGSGSALWSALQGGGLFTWSPVARVAALARLDAAVPFARPTFVIDGLGAVYRSGEVVGRATLGVEVRLP